MPDGIWVAESMAFWNRFVLMLEVMAVGESVGAGTRDKNESVKLLLIVYIFTKNVQ